MLLRTETPIPSSEITPKEVFESFKMTRRRVLSGLGAVGAAAATAGLPQVALGESPLKYVGSKYTVPDRAITPEAKAKSYNNFYEFGEDKGDPARNAHTLKTYPWSVKIEGLCKNPQTIDLYKMAGLAPIEQRVYRFRCVEAWSMVIPWDGYSLSELIKVADPLPSAKFVQFISLEDSKTEMLPSGIQWPYSEGLRIDEAMNPLTLLTFGSYGETLANQQGAPVRVIVPWKYGFKSPKSIVRIKFVKSMPSTTWNELAPDEYGFYSNVNPTVDHPRWTQAHERLLNTNSIFPKVVPTLMFNGYSDQVASMYAGMDLRKNY
ncbi:protein-methionine-sulfoxide reductase catalytic subunit MsrP [Granulicella sp. 5B5]|uniref:protein-methionine-sulfoxide reductase catalytic subunit MsrP n=1 Tax=Granulicella sp. 5B5 TaxID=1617967 RepID=UPI0015F3BB40|nr:protein-methionine-sulfoxide reductase catalytic subunit MsrP [Granulicella sp. 5B5]QMV20051.1 protein-methionine-sulfoxide reductase catalytic subunit MsrP [Granulicella sp. 5B5]